MIKTVTILSLSRGMLGEEFARHELEIGLRRLEEYGLRVKFGRHALMGLDYVKNHPEARAADLLEAFADPETDMIITAIGGDDTYRLLPYLFAHGELAKAVTKKTFLGFSDTTINHLMLHKVGLPTFYGQAFIPDVCELDREMLPYTRQYFEELISTGAIGEITPSPVWYDERTDFSPAAVGTARPAHPDTGFRLLQGPAVFSGKILGGCIDTLFDIFDGERYADMPALCREYGLFPAAEDWKGRILLLETSEEKMEPEKIRRAAMYLKEAGVFSAVSGVLVGKPMDRAYEREYLEALTETVDDPALPIVCNLNVGHATPRCIIPFGVEATVDAEAQRITFAQGR
ncbi:MAG: LD-carboxypeptidase [Oscillospiraceae bacterium]|nr:LD-carboxypeptidase [Oscillospiraceae bacterium]